MVNFFEKRISSNLKWSLILTPTYIKITYTQFIKKKKKKNVCCHDGTIGFLKTNIPLRSFLSFFETYEK